MTAINDRGGVVLDQTVFYPTGGGQPGDSGTLIWDGGEMPVAVAVKGDAPDEVVHVPAEGAATPPVGTTVTAKLDWDRRLRHMRVHTGLHLLSVVIPLPVTGGSISAEKGRLDFDANYDQSYDADRDDSPVSLSPDEQSLDDISSGGNGSPDSP